MTKLEYPTQGKLIATSDCVTTLGRHGLIDEKYHILWLKDSDKPTCDDPDVKFYAIQEYKNHGTFVAYDSDKFNISPPVDRTYDFALWYYRVYDKEFTRIINSGGQG